MLSFGISGFFEKTMMGSKFKFLLAVAKRYNGITARRSEEI